MTKFVIVRPEERAVETIEAPTLQAAEDAAGLHPMSTDHGVIAKPWDGMPGIAFVVYEYSFFVNRGEQSFFAIGSRLIAGNAVFYGFDEAGETVDMPPFERPRWFANANEVEAAIAAGDIIRPRNSGLDWEWPQPRPEGLPDGNG